MTQRVEVGMLRFFVLHEIACLDLDPAAAGFARCCSGIHIDPRSKRVGASCSQSGQRRPPPLHAADHGRAGSVSGQRLHPDIVELRV